MELDHVQIAAPPGCEDAARAFYAGLLGCEELPKPAELAARGGCWFRVGALELHVGVEEDFVPARKAHPGFVVDDLAALAARFAEHGIETRPDHAIPGVERFYADDPFGNRLEFRERPTNHDA
jgi:catechol 2,3-dioxygenase-like lactoylglutathione lyase family enzyme